MKYLPTKFELDWCYSFWVIRAKRCTDRQTDRRTDRNKLITITLSYRRALINLNLPFFYNRFSAKHVCGPPNNTCIFFSSIQTTHVLSCFWFWWLRFPLQQVQYQTSSTVLQMVPVEQLPYILTWCMNPPQSSIPQTQTASSKSHKIYINFTYIQ